MKKIEKKRKTSETDIEIAFAREGKGKKEISTGIGFFDHMLELFAFHGDFDLKVKCRGDLKVDPHHSIEDTAILLGQVIDEFLADKAGIQRYAFNYLPMDETLCRTVLDISGRPYHVFKCEFSDSSVGEFPVAMTEHFFYSLAVHSKITLHQEILYGQNDHHKIEALFKSFARSLSSAMKISGDKILSSKGVL